MTDRSIMNPLSVLLFLSVSMLPIYPFGSGGMQPTHIVLAFFASIRILSKGIPITPLTIILLLLFVQSFFVEGIYTVLGGNPAMIIHSIFLLYNFVIVATVYGYCREFGIGSLLPGFYVATAISIVTVLILGVSLQEAGSGRAVGSFNNPNQLGYFSVCVLSLTYLFYREGLMLYIVAVALFTAALFLAVLSLSKAAMLTNFIVLSLALKPRVSRYGTMLWLFCIMGCAFALVVLYQQGVFDQYLFVQRIENMSSEDDSSLESRGYFAILEANGFQLVFGLGNDLVDKIIGHEVHSTPASFLNNYGLLGFLLFTSLVIYWITALWRSYGLVAVINIVGPSLLYGITHNGSRFTIFWLLVAASTAMAQRTRHFRTSQYDKS